jgi:hypothetical protein
MAGRGQGGRPSTPIIPPKENPMSIWTSAYLAYGFEIPKTDEDALDTALGGLDGDVGHLSVGAYDRERLYLVTACHEAELGSPETVDLNLSAEQRADWDRQLEAALSALGMPFGATPAWHLIAAQS